MQRALGSLIKPRMPLLEPTIQISPSQQWVSEFLQQNQDVGCVCSPGIAFSSGDALSSLPCPTPMPLGLFSQEDVESLALGSEVLEPDQRPGECLGWVQLQPCLFRGRLTASVHGQSRA